MGNADSSLQRQGYSGGLPDTPTTRLDRPTSFIVEVHTDPLSSLPPSLRLEFDFKYLCFYSLESGKLLRKISYFNITEWGSNKSLFMFVEKVAISKLSSNKSKPPSTSSSTSSTLLRFVFRADAATELAATIALYVDMILAKLSKAEQEKKFKEKEEKWHSFMTELEQKERQLSQSTSQSTPQSTSQSIPQSTTNGSNATIENTPSQISSHRPASRSLSLQPLQIPPHASIARSGLSIINSPCKDKASLMDTTAFSPLPLFHKGEDSRLSSFFGDDDVDVDDFNVRGK